MDMNATENTQATNNEPKGSSTPEAIMVTSSAVSFPLTTITAADTGDTLLTICAPREYAMQQAVDFAAGWLGVCPTSGHDGRVYLNHGPWGCVFFYNECTERYEHTAMRMRN